MRQVLTIKEDRALSLPTELAGLTANGLGKVVVPNRGALTKPISPYSLNPRYYDETGPSK